MSAIIEIEKMFGKQIECLNESDVLEAIDKANTKEKINSLRYITVKEVNRVVLTAWQKKYRELTSCNFCHRPF